MSDRPEARSVALAIEAVLAADASDFPTLLKAAGLDPLEDLAGCDFSDITLRDFSLRKSRLRATNFTNAVFRSVDFSESDCMQANFSNSTISEGRFERTQMAETIFATSRLHETTFMHCTAQRANLKGAKFLQCTLDDVVLDGADLRNSRLYESHVASSLFKGADLRGSSFERTSFGRCSFAGANLDEVVFKEVQLAEIDLDSASVTGAQFINPLSDLSSRMVDILRDKGAKIFPAAEMSSASAVRAVPTIKLERETLGGAKEDDTSETVEEKVLRLKKEGRLGEEAVSDAIGAGQRAFVRAALSALGDVPLAVVDKILSARSPKGVVALSWKAGLSVRTAVQLQTRMGGISPRQTLRPQDGSAYPMSTEEMKWQIEFFGG